jgi:hypothetical protein
MNNSTIKSARLEPRFGGARVLMRLHAANARKKDSGATKDLLVQIGAIEDDSYAEFISMRWVAEGDGISVRIEPLTRAAR